MSTCGLLQQLPAAWYKGMLSPAPAGRWCPEESASLPSRLFFSYVGGLIQLGYRKALAQADLWDVAAQDAAQPVSDNFLFHLSAAQVGGAPATAFSIVAAIPCV
jgi:hypothetical protein